MYSLSWKGVKYAMAARHPGFWNERGRELAARKRYEDALQCYDRALAIRADIPQVLNNRGNVLLNLDRLEEAEASFREALRLEPDFTNAHNNLGSLLECLGRFEEAEVHVRTALRLQPEHALAHYNLGSILYYLGRTTEAVESYRAALRLRPEKPQWHVALALALLLAGRFEEGWQEFEWRWQTERMVGLGPPSRMPRWNGEPIADRVILLLADHGLGDTLQFCRYVPLLASGAGRVILAVQPTLARLLSRLSGVNEIIPYRDRPDSIDLWCGLMSLPHVFGTTQNTIPAAPYLTADPAVVARWRERLAGLVGLRVGLCWAGGRSGNPSQIAIDRRRSIAFGTLAPLGAIPGVQFVSLQTGPQRVEAARPPHGMKLHDFSDDLHDFADTAALIDNLDLVISVDTAVAHLTGALGKPLWILNRFDTCFRWPRDREDSPWYPSARQFRQPTPGDWHSVIRRTTGALKSLSDVRDRVGRGSSEY